MFALTSDYQWRWMMLNVAVLTLVGVLFVHFLFPRDSQRREAKMLRDVARPPYRERVRRGPSSLRDSRTGEIQKCTKP